MTRPAVRLLVLAFVTAGAVSYFASSRPDWLETCLAPEEPPADATPTESTPAAEAPAGATSPFPDDAVPGFESAFGSNALAGIAGTLATFACLVVVVRLVRRAAARAKS